ncbi:Catalyzes the cleavage of p-aminobenzoyl-glutamate to p-aminobenzoate and glutamate,subunit A [Klebsiella pneumoniae IS22]|nr:Catalyzes the cleavage of p-aminobenzoyl-glutamate to p-aminobenzoate and glutamate,subunit A [Klebsiella pneumoniae IS22]
MPQLDEYLRQLAPSMTQWRRDFHLHAESGWLEFRTASKVADILDGLGYQLALGRDVIDADSRMGLPDEETLARAFERAREQARRSAGCRRLKVVSPAWWPRSTPGGPGQPWPFASIWMPSISTNSMTIATAPIAIISPPATPA